ncbi:hypothetical protein [Streptomyces sp. NPDC057939]|uniref:hypothetical protein n=1 Tax=Streptomyces sp. NPDC057939 TaxID=3346284 RepID=UPI0036ECF259
MKWGRAAIVPGLVLLLSGCVAKYDPLFVGGDVSTPVIGWRDCPGSEPDGVAEVGLYEGADEATADSPGELIWHIKATQGNLSKRISIGETPAGFTSLLPMTTQLVSGTTYAVRTNMSSDGGVSGFVTFRPEQLAAGQLVFGDGNEESPEQYRSRDNEDFGCFAA